MNTSHRNVLQLTRELLLQDTINPPGNEERCASICARVLEASGYEVSLHPFAEHRPTVVAKLKGTTDQKPICFTGHVDTVPLGIAPWTKDPFSGETHGDRVFGRGSTDMKGGVAAMLIMAQEIARISNRRAPITLILTSGEEVCNDGAAYVARCEGVLGQAGAMVVGEPSSNYPWIGHKGCVRMRITTYGRSAHASRPELGVNAISKAAPVIQALEAFDFGVKPHPLFGTPTLNMGTISGGSNVNSVPDRTVIGIDMRLIPGQIPEDIRQALMNYLGSDVGVDIIEQAIAIETPANDAWIHHVFDIVTTITGQKPTPAVAPYFTDASILTPAYGHPPTVILGPGELEMAHTTDESCSITRLDQAVALYTKIAADWCKL